jgi:hypothetical protein
MNEHAETGFPPPLHAIIPGSILRKNKLDGTESA